MGHNEKPEDTPARYRSETGISRKLTVFHTNVPNPSPGVRGYSVNKQMFIVDQFDRGELVHAGRAYITSIYNWKQPIQIYY